MLCWCYMVWSYNYEGVVCVAFLACLILLDLLLQRVILIRKSVKRASGVHDGALTVLLSLRLDCLNTTASWRFVTSIAS